MLFLSPVPVSLGHPSSVALDVTDPSFRACSQLNIAHVPRTAYIKHVLAFLVLVRLHHEAIVDVSVKVSWLKSWEILNQVLTVPDGLSSGVHFRNWESRSDRMVLISYCV